MRGIPSLLAGLALALAGCGESPEPGVLAVKVEASPAGTASLVTEIHSVADLVAGVPGVGAAIDLQGPDARPEHRDAARALVTQALIRTIERAAAADGWTDRHNAVMKAQGEFIVSRATRAYQDALGTYLRGMRASVASK